ncbi:MAG: hypothetical protein KME57_22580 [Scytonema hyalinum WJT4-NPBG1]|jgi:hypothetical protein|nr:hypothetical protein [Scytonema hyalinum WJT4-NPBG1]
MKFQIKNIQSLLDKEDKVDLGEEVVFGDRTERSRLKPDSEQGSLELHS